MRAKEGTGNRAQQLEQNHKTKKSSGVEGVDGQHRKCRQNRKLEDRLQKPVLAASPLLYGSPHDSHDRQARTSHHLYMHNLW